MNDEVEILLHLVNRGVSLQRLIIPERDQRDSGPFGYPRPSLRPIHVSRDFEYLRGEQIQGGLKRLDHLLDVSIGFHIFDSDHVLV